MYLPKYGEIQIGMYFFAYGGAMVLWIMSVKNFRFFTNMPENYVSYKYVSYIITKVVLSASAHVCCIEMDAKIKEILQVKD